MPSVKSLLVRARISLAEAAEARKLSCQEVRLELGEAAEGLISPSSPARRHVRDCDRCRSFKRQLKENNHALAAILPVGPLLLVKSLLLTKLGSSASASSAHVASGAGASLGAGAAAGAGAAGGAGAGGALTVGAGALATKAVAGLAAAAIVSAGAVAANQPSHHHRAATAGRVVAVSGRHARESGIRARRAPHLRTRRGEPASAAAELRRRFPGGARLPPLSRAPRDRQARARHGQEPRHPGNAGGHDRSRHRVRAPRRGQGRAAAGPSRTGHAAHQREHPASRRGHQRTPAGRRARSSAAVRRGAARPGLAAPLRRGHQRTPARRRGPGRRAGGLSARSSAAVRRGAARPALAAPLRRSGELRAASAAGARLHPGDLRPDRAEQRAAQNARRPAHDCREAPRGRTAARFRSAPRRSARRDPADAPACPRLEARLGAPLTEAERFQGALQHARARHF